MVYSDKEFIGKKFKEYRQKLNLTQEQVAEKINIDTNHYGKLERGKFNPSVETFLEALSFLEIPIEEFGIKTGKKTDEIKERLTREILLSTKKENTLFLSIIKNIKEFKSK